MRCQERCSASCGVGPGCGRWRHRRRAGSCESAGPDSKARARQGQTAHGPQECEVAVQLSDCAEVCIQLQSSVHAQVCYDLERSIGWRQGACEAGPRPAPERRHHLAAMPEAVAWQVATRPGLGPGLGPGTCRYSLGAQVGPPAQRPTALRMLVAAAWPEVEVAAAGDSAKPTSLNPRATSTKAARHFYVRSWSPSVPAVAPSHCVLYLAPASKHQSAGPVLPLHSRAAPGGSRMQPRCAQQRGVLEAAQGSHEQRRDMARRAPGSPSRSAVAAVQRRLRSYSQGTESVSTDRLPHATPGASQWSRTRSPHVGS
mmetsp:Transcript_29643/g.64513  ORF Transcript_29643/g.64513 Transcript_29643/m.64513 type:complete len:314 (-) Transcript_29643:974-1915(-)